MSIFDDSLARHLEEIRRITAPFDEEMQKLAYVTRLDSEIARLRQGADLVVVYLKRAASSGKQKTR